MAIPNIPGQLTIAQNTQFNGTDQEFIRANTEETVFASASRTATVTSGDLTNYNHRGAIFFLDNTSLPASGSTTVALVLQLKDPTSGKYVEVFRSQQHSATVSTTAITIYPGITSGSDAASLSLPRTFRILAAVSAGATSKVAIFSIGMSLIK